MPKDVKLKQRAGGLAHRQGVVVEDPREVLLGLPEDLRQALLRDEVLRATQAARAEGAPRRIPTQRCARGALCGGQDRAGGSE